MKEVSRKGILMILLRILFLTISIFILLRIVDFRLVFARMQEIPPIVLMLVVLIAVFRVWLTGERWRLVSPDTSCQLSRWQYFRLTMMATPFNLIMPGALGGDFVRIALTMKEVKEKRVDNLIAIVVDRFVGLLSITLLGSASLLFMTDIPDRKIFYSIFVLLFVAYAVAVLIAGNKHVLHLLELIFLRCGKLGERLMRLLETWRQALMFFRSNSYRLFKALLLCLPIHGLSFATLYILSLSLGIGISFFDICLILSLVWVITAVPITISGAGVRELSLIYFLSLYGVEAESAAALSIYTYVITAVLGLIGFCFLIFSYFIITHENPQK